MSDEEQEKIKTYSWSPEDIAEAENGTFVQVGGEITKINERKTKKGKPYANVNLAFGTAEYSIKLWTESLDKFRAQIKPGALVIARGRKDEWNGFLSVVVTDLLPVKES